MVGYLAGQNGSGLSATISGLARDVRRVVRDGAADAQEVARLRWRIDRVRDEVGGASGSTFHRYLDALQSELRGF